MALFSTGTKQDIDNLENWTLETFIDYFNENLKGSKDSELYEAIKTSARQMYNYQFERVNKDTTVKIVNANAQLMQACENYVRERGSAWSTLGRERLKVVNRFLALQNEKNLDALRDFGKMREQSGKVWANVDRIKKSEVTLEGKVEIQGANISERIRINQDGRNGFFTAEQVMYSRGALFDREMDMIDNPKTKASMIGIKRIVTSDRHISLTKTKESPFIEKLIVANEVANRWKAEKDPNKKQEIAGMFNSNHPEFKKMEDELMQHPERVKNADVSLMAINVSCVEGIINAEKEIETKTRKLKEEADKLKEGERENYPEHIDSAKKLIIHANKVLEDPIALQQCAPIGLKMARQELFLSAGKFSETSDLTKGVEQAKRNVATTRMAEALGLGHLVSHSEKMTVHKDGQILEGCFMEFAKGVDLRNTKSVDDLYKISQIDFKRNASYSQAESSLEILDYICGQTDRHVGNMFYQLSEPDEAGKRNIIGLQAIDNDAAFGAKGHFNAEHQVDFDSIFFIDKDLAENVKNIKQEDLECVLGDLLSKEEIQGVVARIENVKKRMETTMVPLDKEDWELSGFPREKFLENTEEMEQRYKKGMENYAFSETVNKSKFESLQKHKINNIKAELSIKQTKIKESEVLKDYKAPIAQQKEVPKAKNVEEKSKEEKYKELISQLNQKHAAQVEKPAPVTPENRRNSVRLSFSELNGKKNEPKSTPMKTEETPVRRNFLGPKKKS